ncbi:hypothetical protein OIU78_006120 [Salix suchowensis]|nr:hypothetical protein OIU78_006120 [Salix suchowensis]
MGKTAMEVKEHFEILLHDVIEIDSGRIELSNYKDEDGVGWTGSCEEEDARQMLHHLKIIGSLRLALHLIICWRRCPLVFTLAGGRGRGRECRNRDLELLSFSIGSSYPVVQLQSLC